MQRQRQTTPQRHREHRDLTLCDRRLGTLNPSLREATDLCGLCVSVASFAVAVA